MYLKFCCSKKIAKKKKRWASQTDTLAFYVFFFFLFFFFCFFTVCILIILCILFLNACLVKYFTQAKFFHEISCLWKIKHLLCLPTVFFPCYSRTKMSSTMSITLSLVQFPTFRFFITSMILITRPDNLIRAPQTDCHILEKEILYCVLIADCCDLKLETLTPARAHLIFKR